MQDAPKKQDNISSFTIPHDSRSDEVTLAMEAEIAAKEARNSLASERERESLNLIKAAVSAKNLRNKILRRYAKVLKSENKARDLYSKRIFVFVLAYIAVALTLIVFNGSYFNCHGYVFGFKISDNVLVALIGSTSINVVGLVTIILRFMFTHHHHKILENSEK